MEKREDMDQTRVARYLATGAIIIIGLQGGPCCARALFPRIQATGKIKGIVLDPNEARIPAVTILIEGAHATRRLTTNDFGEYESEVPAGTYHIKADLPNYFPFRRAAIRVDSGKTVTINVAPAQRVLSVGLEVTEQGVQEPVRMAPLPQYEIFALRSPPRDDLDVLVQYQRRTLRRDTIEYTKAVVSYDSITVYAETIRLERTTFRIEAGGNVIVDDGGQRVRAKRAEVDLRTRSAIISLSF